MLLGFIFSRKKYVEDLLKIFNMLNCKVVATPLNQSKKLQLCDYLQPTDAITYKKLIGKLIYVTHTRSKIAFRFNFFFIQIYAQTTKIHLGATKYILKYLASFVDFGIFYKKQNNCQLEGNSDNYWGGNFDGKKKHY